MNIIHTLIVLAGLFLLFHVLQYIVFLSQDEIFILQRKMGIGQPTGWEILFGLCKTVTVVVVIITILVWGWNYGEI